MVQLKLGVLNTIERDLSYSVKPAKVHQHCPPHLWLDCSVANEDVQMQRLQKKTLSLSHLLPSPTQTGSDSCFQLLRIKGPS